MTETKKVKVYSTPTCPWCTKVKEWLDEHKIEYESIDVAADEKARNYMVEKSGQMGVPVVEIGDEFIVGFNETKLKDLLGVA